MLIAGSSFIIVCTGKGCQYITARTANGMIRGVPDGKVSSFKGIPYAAPPVGEFRWRPPQPLSSWQGVREATEFSANCAKAGWEAAPGSITKGSAEDCLFLNIWRPEGIEEGANFPVMVWIHGGAFVGGSGDGATTSGEEFAKQGVILMTFNYRLGRLGHFAFPALSEKHPQEPKGSYPNGLLTILKMKRYSKLSPMAKQSPCPIPEK